MVVRRDSADAGVKSRRRRDQNDQGATSGSPWMNFTPWPWPRDRIDQRLAPSIRWPGQPDDHARGARPGSSGPCDRLGRPSWRSFTASSRLRVRVVFRARFHQGGDELFSFVFMLFLHEVLLANPCSPRHLSDRTDKLKNASRRSCTALRFHHRSRESDGKPGVLVFGSSCSELYSGNGDAGLARQAGCVAGGWDGGVFLA